MPRLSEVAKQQETMMDQVMAENSRLKIELRDLRTTYNEAVGERDQLRNDCMIVRQLESKGVLDLFAQWARQ
jgi:regulator of replication initiation timing